MTTSVLGFEFLISQSGLAGKALTKNARGFLASRIVTTPDGCKCQCVTDSRDLIGSLLMDYDVPFKTVGRIYHVWTWHSEECPKGEPINHISSHTLNVGCWWAFLRMQTFAPGINQCHIMRENTHQKTLFNRNYAKWCDPMRKTFRTRLGWTLFRKNYACCFLFFLKFPFREKLVLVKQKQVLRFLWWFSLIKINRKQPSNSLTSDPIKIFSVFLNSIMLRTKNIFFAVQCWKKSFKRVS